MDLENGTTLRCVGVIVHSGTLLCTVPYTAVTTQEEEYALRRCNRQRGGRGGSNGDAKGVFEILKKKKTTCSQTRKGCTRPLRTPHTGGLHSGEDDGAASASASASAERTSERARRRARARVEKGTLREVASSIYL